LEKRLKEYLAHRQAVVFSGHVLCGDGKNLSIQHDVIYETSTTMGAGCKPAGYGQLVVGYDDNVGIPSDAALNPLVARPG
jgi:hypothetical protein